MARRATVIKEVSSESSNPVLVLDAGSSLFGRPLAVQSEGRVIVAAMNALGYDAMAVGSMDLAYGVGVLQARAEEADFKILSCNLVSVEDGALLFPPYVILDRDGMRFGVLGVTEQVAELRSGSDGEAFKVLDPLIAVQEYLPELEERSDVVILLSHLGLEEDHVLAERVAGIDIIIGGKSRKLMSAPEEINGTVIMQAGFSGEWIGKLDVVFDGGGQVLGASGRIITLDPEVEDDPELKALVAEYKERYPTPTPVQGG